MRTQLESSLVGIIGMMLVSLGIAIFTLFFTDLNWGLKVLTGIGELFLFIFMFSNLMTAYLQYYSHKMMLGLYKDEDKLSISIDEAKETIKNLENLIKEIEMKGGNEQNVK
jgi:hypothetical protein